MQWDAEREKRIMFETKNKWMWISLLLLPVDFYVTSGKTLSKQKKEFPLRRKISGKKARKKKSPIKKAVEKFKKNNFKYEFKRKYLF